MVQKSPLTEPPRRIGNEWPAAKTQVIRKQVSFYLPAHDWQRLKDEAARRNVPISEICTEQMESLLSRLRKNDQTNAQ